MIWSIFIKSIKEQIRNFWVLMLTVSMAPFFVFVYFLINEASQPQYRALILNLDQGFELQNDLINAGSSVLSGFQASLTSEENIPLTSTPLPPVKSLLKKLRPEKRMSFW